MEAEIKKLLRQASEVAGNSYSPYSNFRVGAALLSESGRIYCGTNVENASYGLTICAERSALFSAVADGCRKFRALAIVADGQALPLPCGACRQVLAEFCDDELPVAVAAMDNLDAYEVYPLGKLLPHAFRM